MTKRFRNEFWMVLVLSPSLIMTACAQPIFDETASSTGGSGGRGGGMTASSATSASSASSASGSGGSMDTCGDGTLDVGEECDDGNHIDADGCEASCWLVCGSGTGADRATRDPSTGHCYLGFSGVTPTWQQAEAYCEAYGGYLAVIDSASENKIARAASLSSSAPWIGFNDLASEAFSNPFGFVKVTGGFLTFNGFDATEPNNNVGDEDCAHFFGVKDFRGPLGWNDAPCSGAPFVAGFLCEVED
jgi:cysteine-rich repeat protein